MPTAAIPIHEMLPEQLELHCINVAKGRSKSASDSFKTLRAASGLSQSKVGQLCNRKFNSISDWELNVSWPDDAEIIMPKLLSAFGIPTNLLIKTFGGDVDETLSAKSYLAHDPVTLENWWFRTKRGKVLTQLTKKAEQGSHAHIRLFYELLEKNQEEVMRTVSADISDTPPKLIEKQRNWLKQSISVGISSSSEVPKK